VYCNVLVLFFIIRDISPKNGSEVFFLHEIYEKYSLAPSLSELWHLSNRYILLRYNFVLFVVSLLMHTLTVLGESCMLSSMHGCDSDSLVQQLVCPLPIVKPQKAGRVWVGTYGLSCLLGGGVVFWGFGDGVWVIFWGRCLFFAFSYVPKRGEV